MSNGFSPEDIAYYKAHANDDYRPNEIAANVCGCVVAVIAIILRIIARRISSARFGLDDWFILGAMVKLAARTVQI
jgi:hypothetical protein